MHPTYGSFWGMGVGIGCGIGWGPGFGPEVIGYVGAGCGVGFHVGVTLLGLGIGFPANFLFAIPHRGMILILKSFSVSQSLILNTLEVGCLSQILVVLSLLV